MAESCICCWMMNPMSLLNMVENLEGLEGIQNIEVTFSSQPYLLTCPQVKYNEYHEWKYNEWKLASSAAKYGSSSLQRSMAQILLCD